jgi:hypothetical protein
VLLDEQKVRDHDITVTHRAPRLFQRACGFSPHSAAAWTETFRPGNSPDNRSDTRAAGPAAWLSSVTITTR